MKKFLLFLLFLLIIGGAGFFLGWVQFSVPAGSYGVMRSKTHGMEPGIIREGEFRWCWYKLIPTNVEIKVFSIKTVHYSINSSGTLPSGNAYAALAGLDTDFSWHIRGDFSFSIKPEALPDLTLRYNLDSQEDFYVMENDLARRVEAYIIQRLARFGEDEDRMEAVLLTGVDQELIREIEAAFPELENIICQIQAVSIPDYRLYHSLMGLYDEYLLHQNRVIREDIIKNAEARVAMKLRLDELEKYGEILTRFPILMDYLAME